MTKTKAVTTDRPTVMTPEVVRKLEEAFTMDCTDEEACAFAGIGLRTYYDHRAADEDFSQRMERAKRFCFVQRIRSAGLYCCSSASTLRRYSGCPLNFSRSFIGSLRKRPPLTGPPRLRGGLG
jgi:hypothetical protein